MQLRHILFFIILFLVFKVGSARNFTVKELQKIDSIYSKIKETSLHDTIKAECYLDLAFYYYQNNPDTAIFFIENLIQLSDKHDYLVGLSDGYGWLGYLYAQVKGNTKKGLINFEKCIEIKRQLKDSAGVSSTLNNIAYVLEQEGNEKEAIPYYNQSLEIDKKLGNKTSMATTLSNIGRIYFKSGNVQKALDYSYKTLKLREEVGDQEDIARSYGNLGTLYYSQGDVESAINYYKKSLAIHEKENNKPSIVDMLLKLSEIQFKEGNDVEADKNNRKALKIAIEIGSKPNIIEGYINLGNSFIEENRFDSAEVYYSKALAISKEIQLKYYEVESLLKMGDALLKAGNLNESMNYVLEGYELAEKHAYAVNIKNSSSLLSSIYEKQGNSKKALAYYKTYIQMRDSINNEETQKAAIRQQTQYEFEKEQIRKENEAKEKARIEAEELKRRNNLQYSLIFLGILLLFGIVLSLGFIKVSPNIAEGLIFFTFLIFFEFLLVFTEPYLERYTQGEPVYALLANSALALIIFPLHAVLERLLKKRIVK